MEIPMAVAEYVRLVEGGRVERGLTVPTERLQAALQGSGWTLAELDVYIKEHCMAVRSRSADGTKQYYEYLEPVDPPAWTAPPV